MGISVIIPTHDRNALLKDAVASIYAQSLLPKEVIVVNNGSTPLPKGLLPDSVQIIEIAAHAGASIARNTGAKAATSELIAFLDDDDLWHKNFLEELKGALDQQQADCCLGDFYKGCANKHTFYKSISAHIPNLKRTLLHKNPGFGGGNFLIKRQAFLKVNGFPEHMHMAEDQVLATELAFSGHKIISCPKAKYIIRDLAPTRLSLQPPKGYLQFYHQCKKYMTTLQKARFLLKILYKKAKYHIKQKF